MPSRRNRRISGRGQAAGRVSDQGSEVLERSWVERGAVTELVWGRIVSLSPLVPCLSFDHLSARVL